MNNAKKIWDILLANGCTKAGAAGVIGNMEAESGLEPCRMQGDFNRAENYPASKAYAARIDDGRMTRSEFAYDTVGGGGWGLCQWTFWSRKADLYDHCKNRGASIGDLTAQVEFFCKECKERYTEVWKVISTTTDVQSASNAVLLKYERPADMYSKQIYRGNRGKYYFDLLANDTPAEETAPPKEETAEPAAFALPILKRGDKGTTVEAAQILLAGYGFRCGSYGSDGDFGSATETATKRYQTDRGLATDGIIGSATWKSLLGVR